MNAISQPRKKPFSWSWSRLKNYRTCPKRHWHVDIAKEFSDDSEQLRWGNQVHDAIAAGIGKGTQLPATMQHYENWVAKAREYSIERGYEILVENKLAMSEKRTPTSFFDAATWFRGVLDVIILNPQDRVAVVWDWKTGGSIKPEFEQLGLFASLVFAHYPEIDEVTTIYVWLGHDDYTHKVYKRDGMLPLWNELQSMLNSMIESWRTTTYPPNPSGLCISYCPVTSCPHHGKGNR